MGGSSSKSSQKPVDVTPSAFKNLQQPFADVVAAALPGIPQGTERIVEGFQGPTTAPITGAEQQALGQVQSLSQGMTPFQLGSVPTTQGTTGLGDFASQLAGASQTGAFGGDNPFLQQFIEAAQRPTLQGLEETLSRTLPGRFTQAGQFIQPGGSSAFDRAAAIATRGAGDTLGDIATNISYQALEAARGREAGALESELGRREQRGLTEAQAGLTEAQRQAVGPQVQSQQIQNAIANLQAQALPRLIQDLGVERGIEAFNNNVNALLSSMGIAAGVTRPVVAQEGKSSSKGFSI